MEIRLCEGCPNCGNNKQGEYYAGGMWDCAHCFSCGWDEGWGIKLDKDASNNKWLDNWEMLGFMPFYPIMKE